MYKYKRLKELREDNDLNQKQVADVIGTTFQYYSSYERGIRDLPLERAIKLAIFYNVSIDYIAGLTKESKPHWQNKNNNINISQGNHNINNIKIK